MDTGRRPTVPAEADHLHALGQLLHALRTEAAMTQQQVAARATLSAAHVAALEHGRRRTRRSTLARLVDALVAEHRRPAILAELAEAAGPALAPESDYAERVARRRSRREARELPLALQATRDAQAAARRLTRLYPAGHPRHAWALEQVATLERQATQLEERLAQSKGRDRDQLRRPSARTCSGPADDRPARTAYLAYVEHLTGGRRRGTLRLTGEQRRRLDELRLAAEAEADALERSRRHLTTTSPTSPQAAGT